jgi:hypothetical protein
MASSPKNGRDKAWFVWFIIQIVIIFRMSQPQVPRTLSPPRRVLDGGAVAPLLTRGTPVVDAVQFYPPQLYKAPGSPLYFLQQIKDFYVATYNDPLVQPETEPNWMHMLSVVEMGLQLPVALYAAWRLGGSRGTSGPFELLLLVYAFETAFSTLLCINDVFYWDPAIYSQEQKNVFLFQLYGPWLIIRESSYCERCRFPRGFG